MDWISLVQLYALIVIGGILACGAIVSFSGLEGRLDNFMNFIAKLFMFDIIVIIGAMLLNYLILPEKYNIHAFNGKSGEEKIVFNSDTIKFEPFQSMEFSSRDDNLDISFQTQDSIARVVLTENCDIIINTGGERMIEIQDVSYFDMDIRRVMSNVPSEIRQRQEKEQDSLIFEKMKNSDSIVDLIVRDNGTVDSIMYMKIFLDLKSREPKIEEYDLFNHTTELTNGYYILDDSEQEIYGFDEAAPMSISVSEYDDGPRFDYDIRIAPEKLK